MVTLCGPSRGPGGLSMTRKLSKMLAFVGNLILQRRGFTEEAAKGAAQAALDYGDHTSSPSTSRACK